MYKLIATDMDGTLLNSDVCIPQSNVDAIIEVQKKGVKFVLATGRPTFATFESAKILEMDNYGGYIISNNGGEIIECKTKKRLFSQGIDKSDVISLYNFANDNGLTFLTYNDGKIYTNSIDEYSSIEGNFTGADMIEIDDINNLDFEQIIKCMLLSSPEKVKELQIKMNESSFSNKLFFAISHPSFLEVVNKNVNKGVAITKLLEILNIDKSEAISSGDSYNDLPLLENTGLKVAPANAKEDIKNIVDYVGVDNNTGILADLIYKFVL